MPSPAILLIIATLLPLVSFLILVFIGKKMGTPLAGWVAATFIFIVSIGYMREDKRFPRFFTYLSLFDFSMLGLLLGGTVLQLFIFWELVGLCRSAERR